MRHPITEIADTCVDCGEHKSNCTCPVEDVDGDNLCEIRKSANEMIFILQNLIYGDKKRSRNEMAELEVLSKHAYWILSKTN